MGRLFVVSDVIVIPGKGLVLLPGMPGRGGGVRRGTKLELVRPDGSRVLTRAVGVEAHRGTTRVCVPFDALVGPGTEVWLRPVA
jgi:hypothetical protein